VKFAPHILAEIRLLPTEAGGRKGPTPPDVFVCQMGGGEYFEMRMDLSSIGSLSPGSTARVPIRFSHPEYINFLIQVGTEFALSEIGESGKIGGGKVLEVYDENFAA
jgi:hypothetical protein